MGAVDWFDMMIISIRKSLKWYKKFFLHFPGNVLLNILAVYNVKIVRNISMADFQPIPIRKTLQKYHKAKQSAKTGWPSSLDQSLWFTERHFPSLVPSTEKKKNAARHCHTVISVQTQLLLRHREKWAGMRVPSATWGSV